MASHRTNNEIERCLHYLPTGPWNPVVSGVKIELVDIVTG
jgi:hypothetical protein